MAPDTHHSTKSYSSVRATELVGRKTELAEIAAAVRDSEHSYLVQILGVGGIGKTKLMKAVLKRYHDDPTLMISRDLIDLYHISAHSIAGLMASIQRAVSSDDAGFEAYHKARNALNRYLAEPTGAREKLQELQKSVRAAFLNDLNALSQERRLVLALDTAETLVYEVSPVEKALGLSQEGIATWGWLRDEFLPGIQNAVVLIAGRPIAGQLTSDLQQVRGKKYQRINLSGFSEEEALAYFEAVAETADKAGNAAIAQRIHAVPEATRRMIAQKTGRRPIFLALVIDYLIVANHLPPNLVPLDTKALESELVRTIQETNRPADEAIRALAWARKGMDAELLARVADLRTGDGNWDIELARSWLDEIRDLSFVKIRPQDQRVFLHDEMYDLLARHVLRPQQNQAQAGRVYSTILAYYQQHIKRTRDALAEAYQELERRGGPAEGVDAGVPAAALARIAEITARLQEALVEDLHYQLRADARNGFDAYSRYAEEAALGENTSLDMQLRAELLGFLAERDPTGIRPKIDGLSRQIVYADGAIRWVKRRIAAEQYQAARDLAIKIRKSNLVPSGNRLAEAELATWEALAQLYGGLANPEIIEQALQVAIKTLESLPQTWQRNTVLARAYNNLGYLYRILGRHWGAIDAYWKAIPLWRASKIAAERANTLNNLAFARSEIGDFGTAQRQAGAALELRRQSGARPQIGLSLDTLAYIALRGTLYITARRHAMHALAMFEAAKDNRGRGLALVVLAEAKRRFGAEGPCTNKEAENLLQEAADHAQEAVAILKATGEPSRQVEALIELGCAYRDWMKLRRRYAGGREETVESLADKSKKRLEEARRVAAEQRIAYRQTDALINEAWLHYYLEVYYRWIVDQPIEARYAHDRSEQCLNEAEALIPPSYKIIEVGVPPLDPERAVVPLLAQLGKTQLLRGQITFNEFEDHEDQEELKKAIRYYTLSLAYDDLVSKQQFREKRRGKDRIYERLRKLNIKKWRVVYDEVERTEDTYHLGRSEMRRFLEDNFGPSESLRSFRL